MFLSNIKRVASSIGYGLVLTLLPVYLVTDFHFAKVMMLPWQELAGLSAYVAFFMCLECLQIQFRHSISHASRAKLGMSSFFFLYVATATLSQKTQIGTISGTANVISIIKGTGVAVVVYLLFKALSILKASLKQNGMVVKSELKRAFDYVILSGIGLSLCFSSWFPLAALPGASIAAKWWFDWRSECAEKACLSEVQEQED